MHVSMAAATYLAWHQYCSAVARCLRAAAAWRAWLTAGSLGRRCAPSLSGRATCSIQPPFVTTDNQIKTNTLRTSEDVAELGLHSEDNVAGRGTDMLKRDGTRSSAWTQYVRR